MCPCCFYRTQIVKNGRRHHLTSLLNVDIVVDTALSVSGCYHLILTTDGQQKEQYILPIFNVLQTAFTVYLLICNNHFPKLVY